MNTSIREITHKWICVYSLKEICNKYIILGCTTHPRYKYEDSKENNSLKTVLGL